MTSIVIDIYGDRQLSRKLVRAANRALDLAPGLERVHDEVLLPAARKQFATSGAYGSGGWRPLATTTVLAKKGRGSILVLTGALRRSMTQDGPDHIKVIDRSTLFIQSALPYAEFHQRGTSRMPQRRLLELPEGDRKKAVKILQASIIDQMRGSRVAAAA